MMSILFVKVFAFFITAGFAVYFGRELRICLNEGREGGQVVMRFVLAAGCAVVSFLMMVGAFGSTYERPSDTSSIGQEYCATVLKEWQVAQGGGGDIFGSNPVNTVWKIGLRDESGSVSSQVISDEDYFSIKVGDQVTVRREKSGFSTVMGGPVLVNRVYPGCKK